MGNCRTKHEMMIPEKGCEKVVRKASGHVSCEKDVRQPHASYIFALKTICVHEMGSPGLIKKNLHSHHIDSTGSLPNGATSFRRTTFSTIFLTSIPVLHATDVDERWRQGWFEWRRIKYWSSLNLFPRRMEWVIHSGPTYRTLIESSCSALCVLDAERFSQTTCVTLLLLRVTEQLPPYNMTSFDKCIDECCPVVPSKYTTHPSNTRASLPRFTAAAPSPQTTASPIPSSLATRGDKWW